MAQLMLWNVPVAVESLEEKREIQRYVTIKIKMDIVVLAGRDIWLIRFTDNKPYGVNTK